MQTVAIHSAKPEIFDRQFIKKLTVIGSDRSPLKVERVEDNRYYKVAGHVFEYDSWEGVAGNIRIVRFMELQNKGYIHHLIQMDPNESAVKSVLQDINKGSQKEGIVDEDMGVHFSARLTRLNTLGLYKGIDFAYGTNPSNGFQMRKPSNQSASQDRYEKLNKAGSELLEVYLDSDD